MFSTGCRHASSPFPGEKHSQDDPPETVAPGEDGGENPSQLKTAVYTTEKGILTVTEPGILPEEAVAKALGSGTDLKITGPIIPENYKLLKGKGITILDLSGVTGLSEGSISVSMDVEGLLNYQDFIPLDFYGDTEIKTVKLPSTAKALPECSFTGCPSLVSVTGSGLEIIGYSAFSGTALETADFPNAKKIGYNAFGGCRKLETLKLPSAEKLGCDLLYHRGSGNLSITLPGNLEIPDKLEQIENEYPEHVFRGVNTESISLTLTGGSTFSGNTWKGYTWKEILTSE